MKLSVELNPDTFLSLRALAQHQGCMMAELAQEILSKHAGTYKRPPISGLGEFDSGTTDTSDRAEEILREAAKRGRWRAR